MKIIYDQQSVKQSEVQIREYYVLNISFLY